MTPDRERPRAPVRAETEGPRAWRARARAERAAECVRRGSGGGEDRSRHPAPRAWTHNSWRVRRGQPLDRLEGQQKRRTCAAVVRATAADIEHGSVRACDVTINDPGFAAGADDVSRPESGAAAMRPVTAGVVPGSRAVRIRGIQSVPPKPPAKAEAHVEERARSSVVKSCGFCEVSVRPGCVRPLWLDAAAFEWHSGKPFTRAVNFEK